MKKYNFNFVGKFPLSVILSTVLVLGSIFLLVSKGLNYGVDFRGGAEVQVKFSDVVDLPALRSALDEGKFGTAQVQTIGDGSTNEYLIKINEKDLNAAANKITILLKASFPAEFPDPNNKEDTRVSPIEKTDIVGPKAGERLRISGFQAMAWALLMIMVYIALRFDYKYSPGAIVALLHDVLIIIGIFILTQKQFSLQIVGALLAVIGYSVNDTVVVYDRVREHEEKSPGKGLSGLINLALNETLSRTFLTSLTTFLIAFVMYLMGGAGIEDFFFAICLGVIVGTYSSLFVAAPTVMAFDKILSKK
jgi:preprotein translocase subunit SecF